MQGSNDATAADGWSAVLTAFRRALAREMDVLRRDPGLLWQQLYNRLQWEDEPVRAVVEPEFSRRSSFGASPWVRARTPFRESEALLRTLAGHTHWVFACAYSPDGARVVSASQDKTLKLWDGGTGGCLATLPLLGSATAAGHHPHRASVACADAGGSVYFVDLVGITMGTLVVTAVDLGNGPAVRCPVCFQRHPLQEAWLGREMDCPGGACHARLRLNPFGLTGPQEMTILVTRIRP